MINFLQFRKRHSTAHNGTKTMHHTPCACAFWKKEEKRKRFFFWEKSERTETNESFLILEDGNVFTGTSIGSTREVISEIVFNTSMTGYLEVLTDPSYVDRQSMTSSAD